MKGGRTMKNRKIGKTFTFTDKCEHAHKLITEELHSGDSCVGCFFDESGNNCHEFRHHIGHCHAFLRLDGKAIIFKEVK